MTAAFSWTSRFSDPVGLFRHVSRDSRDIAGLRFDLGIACRCASLTKLDHRIAVIALLFLILCGVTFSQESNLELPKLHRHALVIGMASYKALPVPLEQAIYDAKAMRGSLQDLGFQVDYVENAPLVRLDIAVEGFVEKVQEGDVALVYYAGHGIQIRGGNYLIPIDFDATEVADAEDETYSVSKLLRRLRTRGAQLNIVVLDACRTNAVFAGVAATGLAKADPETPNTYLAMATLPNDVVMDERDSKGGAFTRALVEVLMVPGLTLDEVFHRVRIRVSERTNGTQAPSTTTNLSFPFVFRDKSQAEYALAVMQNEATRLQARVKEAEQLKAKLSQAQKDEVQQYDQERRELQARLEQLAKDRKQREEEKQAILELERRRQETEVSKRDEELAKQQAEERAHIATLRQKAQQVESTEGLALEEARKLVTMLRASIAERRAALAVARNKEMGLINATYSERRRSLERPMVKDVFETSVEFAQRRRKQEEVLASLDSRWAAARAETTTHYDDELASQEEPLQEQIGSLRTRLYRAEPSSVTWKDYNADTSTLTVAVGPFLYRFEISPAKAKDLYDRRDKLRLESQYRYQEQGAPPVREGIVLVDPLGDRFFRVELPPLMPRSGSKDAASMATRDQAYWTRNRFDDFEAGASEELSAGLVLTFTLQHHHVMNNVHPARVSVSTKRIVFEVISSGLGETTGAASVDGPPKSCDLDRFSTDIRNFVSAEVTTNKQGELFITFKIRDGNNPTDVHSLTFADQYASKRKWISKGALGIGLVRRSVTSRPEAERALTAIQRTIQRAAAQARASN